MLSNLILSLNTVLPLLLVMTTGYVIRGIGLMSEQTVRQVNNVNFRVFLPILLMNNIRKANVAQAGGLSVLIYTVAALILLFAVMMWAVPRFVKEDNRRGVVVQAMFRSNYAMFGLAVIANLYPGQTLTLPSLMIPATAPFYNILAVICLEAFRGGKADVKTMLRKIARNPLIIACLLGILLLAIGNPVPTFIDTALSDLGGLATTMALFVLGASFRLEALKGNGKLLAQVTTIKLVVIPLIVLLVGILLGYRQQALASLLAAFGGPIAVSSFTMAQQMDGDGDLAAQLVISTTLFSVLTLFVFIFAFKMLGML